ncbi:hypothetical protein CMQ_6993 [Grosmannia clavigera kw1407]|uniref:ABC transporter TMD0 domain-containing protein n=1 Tax=Grosmannia clavigera (strain kw1407 / UAMH 11150) TaxID=655863 RepID=F0X6U6_GROCL|nr:uncharacterized protein CMQ_6993 [Grosmannia clavigera kw1407]EFX06672.1 hypothetical protein CMQ_6993 [Grosmannia clavigera kw1407]
MDCPRGSDYAFGPRIRSECRSFDFTLQFEDSLFGCLPAATFLLLAAADVIWLVRSPVAYQRQGGIVSLKLCTLASLLAAQLALLVVRVRVPAISSGASLPADILASLAVLAATTLLVLYQQRASRPSTVLSLHLSATVLLGVARVRTLWLVAN